MFNFAINFINKIITLLPFHSYEPDPRDAVADDISVSSPDFKLESNPFIMECYGDIESSYRKFHDKIIELKGVSTRIANIESLPKAALYIFANDNKHAVICYFTGKRRRNLNRKMEGSKIHLIGKCHFKINEKDPDDTCIVLDYCHIFS